MNENSINNILEIIFYMFIIQLFIIIGIAIFTRIKIDAKFKIFAIFIEEKHNEILNEFEFSKKDFEKKHQDNYELLSDFYDYSEKIGTALNHIYNSSKDHITELENIQDKTILYTKNLKDILDLNFYNISKNIEANYEIDKQSNKILHILNRKIGSKHKIK